MGWSTLDPLHKSDDVTLSNGDRTATNTVSSGDRLVLSTHGQLNGKYYFEIEVNDAGGGGTLGIGIAPPFIGKETSLQFDPNAWSYLDTNGNLGNNNSNSAYGDSYTDSDIIGVALDLDNGILWFSKNGTWQNGASITEVQNGTTTNAATSSIDLNEMYFVAVNLTGTGTDDQVTVRLDPADITGTVPSGFTEGWPSSDLASRFNPLDKNPNNFLIDGNWTLQARSIGSEESARADIAKTSGKHYFEFYIQSMVTDATVGISDSDDSLAFSASFGIDSWGYKDNGRKANNNTSVAYGSGWTTGDVIGIALDIDNDAIWFSLNGVWQGGATIGEIEAGTLTNAAYSALGNNEYIPIASCRNLGEIFLRSDPNLLEYTVPTGFSAGWQASIEADVTLDIPVSLTSSGSVPIEADVILDIPVSLTSLAIVPTEADVTLDIPVSLTSSATHPQVGDVSLNIPVTIVSTGEVPVEGETTLSIPVTLDSTGSIPTAGTTLLNIPVTITSSVSVELSVAFSYLYGDSPVQQQFIFPITYNVQKQSIFDYSILDTVQKQFTFSYDELDSIEKQFVHPYELKSLNDVRRVQTYPYSLATPIVITGVNGITISHLGSELSFSQLSLSMSQNQFTWTGQILLEDVAQYQNLSIDDAITIDLNGEIYNLIVDSKSLVRTSPVNFNLVIRLISPTAIYLAKRATKITQEYGASTANALVNSILGTTVTWNIIDWSIPSDRLSVVDATPYEVARLIVAAAGAILETQPDGSIVVHYQFPNRVPDWYSATPDEIFTDIDHRLSVRELTERVEIFNKFNVRDTFSDTFSLQAEVDRRDNGLNISDTFLPGDKIAILVFKDNGVSINTIDSSSGTVLVAAGSTFTEVQRIQFDSTDSVNLTRPAKSIISTTWLGTSLGSLTLSSDGETVTASSIGTAIAEVELSFTAEAYQIDTPPTVAGSDEYPVLVSFKGSGPSGLGISISTQRGLADSQGPDIIDPLISAINVAVQRGRNAIDAASNLKTVRQDATYRTGLRLGQLIEVSDALQGQTWRGQIRSIDHQFRDVELITRAEVLKLEPTSS